MNFVIDIQLFEYILLLGWEDFNFYSKKTNKTLFAEINITSCAYKVYLVLRVVERIQF